MKRLQSCICFIVLTYRAISVTADEGLPRLLLGRSGTALELSWPGTVKGADGSLIRPYFELQRSRDLQLWQPVGERQRATPAALPSQSLNLTLGADDARAFYRLLSIQPPNVAKLGSGGAEVFGYADAFAQELQRIGQISPDQFVAMFPNSANYLPGISWDPTTAQYWDQFNADPSVVNQDKQPDQPGYRSFDARLSAPELALFKTNGFVVSERLGANSFAEVFYNLWHNDLPVFISCDALLQAWHRTYDAILEETEETYLINSVQTILDGMASQLTVASAEVGNGVLQDSLRDADYFLAVARSLLAGTNNPPVPSVLGQDARVVQTLADIQAEQLKTVDDFMGSCRVVDFSQFKVRGHYTHTERLGRYFQCVMWLGRIDFAVAGGPFDRGCGPEFPSPREMGSAIVLWRLLNQSGQFTTWLNFDRIIQAFVGWTDSLSFAQLGGVLAGAGIRTLADVPDLATLQNLQTNIVHGDLGAQNVRSDYFLSPLGPQQAKLPQSFTVFGQKFVPDSWAFSQTVYDSILWVQNGITNKVERRVPGALDTAFAIFGNDQIVPELVAQMNGTFQDPGRPHALKWRDGNPYQHNLAAARAVMDAQQPSAWDSNIYMGWLTCLRELSAPTTGVEFPEAVRTRAWAMKTLNTQLASWTQLRHDTILHAKQSYTSGDACSYPSGFVEPRVAFWLRLGMTATRTADLIASLPYEGTYPVATNQWQIDPSTGESNLVATTVSIPLTVIQINQVTHLRSFANTLTTLQTLAEKELVQECFSTNDEKFIDGLMENRQGLGCGGPFIYTGWYPRLFYRTSYWTNDVEFHQTYGAGAFDALVADVHTDVPDLIVDDLGSVLHEGIGQVNLLMFAVDNGADHFTCAGPVFSHYEFEVLGDPRRLDDNEWRQVVYRNDPPDVPASRIEGLAPPVWTQRYLVPLPAQ